MTNNDWEDFKKEVIPLKQKKNNVKKKVKDKISIVKKIAHDLDQNKIDIIEQEESNLSLHQLEKNTLKRIKKGKIKVESTLDLHGYTLAESKKKVANFIFKSHKTNKRLLLIITGKGKKRSSENLWGEDLGKLKKTVPLWLNSDQLSKYILWYDIATRQNGGEGALMIYLKKAKV